MSLNKREKIAVVTGGGGGIGAAISTLMAKDGFSVAILDCNLETAEHLALELNAHGGNSKAFLCDVSRPEDIESAFNNIIDYYGRIDVLANNAGAGGYLAWEDMTMEQWHRLFSVNCNGAFLCIQRAAKEMIRLGIKGKIIITLSQASFTQDESIVVPYCTSKWAARGLMRSAAADRRRYCFHVFLPGKGRTSYQRPVSPGSRRDCFFMKAYLVKRSNDHNGIPGGYTL